MKANEAPEKIILSADRETGKLYDEWVTRDLTDNIKIEYTRTDAFIKKACEFLQINLWRVANEEPDFRQRFVTDFRKYMNGE